MVRPRHCAIAAIAVTISALFVVVVPASASSAGSGVGSPSTASEWRWPVEPVRIAVGYVQPADRYAPGHRGIDLAVSEGTLVRAPADGVIAFAGDVAGRGVVTIAHRSGLVSTLEPVTAIVAVGEAVQQGTPVGTVAVGGHTAFGAVHFGVRLDGEYLNPLLLLGGVPRAVLLPCCD